jgi:geranylgeranyl diphosphate synthase type II
MNQTATSSNPTPLEALTAPVERVDAFMAEFLDSRAMPANLRDAVKYSALGPGKRMRPLLVIHACQAVGGTIEQALPAAGAIELIHAFSLVHDDLPAMDDDDLRRGRPTLHRHTNEAMAILAGDAMMTLAFDLIFTQIHPAELASRIAAELTAGTSDMISGQVYDTLPESGDDLEPLEKLKRIHRHKTGALIRAACRMGAQCGNSSEAHVAALTQYGDAIGLMFQIVDDVIDVTQTTEHLGKTAGKDIDQNKLTYPAVMGLEASRQEVERLRIEANDVLSDLGPAAEPLIALADYLAVRTK